MPIDLYYLNLSPYCRSVLLTARAVGVELNLKTVNLFAKEQLKPEFVAINPQHSVPTLVDGDLVLWESRPICTYLISQYGKDDSLYPKEPKARAKVDALLHFDIGTLAACWTAMIAPVKAKELPKPEQKSVDKFHEALGWLNGFLSHKKYAAETDHITVADLVLVANVSSYEAAGFIINDYPNISAWLQRCKQNIDGYEELNGESAKKLGEYIKSMITEK
ncbi:glutathione S-transferase 1-like isoform X2 [Homarus americanus]|uniref:Glutathione S-transferase 1-like 3 n=2 Tax=Homarus americanus TaxID=6706 RepID=A0A8J5JYE1_HOMAM|nr:glutathione S-transferase 1-like isoform X2 [Homarus americanus]KAG7164741.1 Glutathione S-transferase 1-like 3 [Homarus americanus]